MLEGFRSPNPENIKEPFKREISERIREHTHFNVGTPSFVNRYMAIPLQRIREVSKENQNGTITRVSEIDTPKGKLWDRVSKNQTSQTAWTEKYPVESLEDIEKLRSIPWEPNPKLAPPDVSALPSDFKERGILATNVSSPFVCVAGMCTYQYFLELCATELELVKELTQMCLERVLKTLDILMSERTVEYVWMGGCEWLTPPMGSPRLYEELVQEFERPVIEKIHESGALSHVHCHGNVRSTIEKVIERGGDFFEPVEPPPDGDITFAEAKKIANGRMALGGNIEGRLIQHENADVVEKAVRDAFEGGKEHMVLKTCAGPICALTPQMVENNHRMLDVWEELSPIS